MNKKIKTRIAPSPTGLLHIGNLRTALYNYLFAKQNDGEFMLRVEDTDQARFVEGAMEKVLEMLSWSEINWDGDIILQSNRLPIYQKYAKQLIEEDKAYYCFCTVERLEKMRQEQQEKKLAPRYDGACKNLTKDEMENNLRENKKYVVRLKVPKDEIIEFEDLVYGKISYNSNDIDDQVLIKSDG
ncbi:glutamate--tRNA ligase, partial [Candidatus Falkowbacteria bacterium CG10_big_fil_rev_8_21_14_0_10_37_6]